MSTATMAVGLAGLAAAAFLFVSLKRGSYAATLTKQSGGASLIDIARHDAATQQTAFGPTGAQVVQGTNTAAQVATTAIGAVGAVGGALKGLFGDSSGSSSFDQGSSLVPDASVNWGAPSVDADPGNVDASFGTTADGNYDFGSSLDFSAGE